MTSSPEPKKILYQLVSPLHLVTGSGEVDRRRSILRGWVSPSIRIDIASPGDGPPVIESQIDAAMVFSNLRPIAPQWAENGYEAVIGPGEASLLAAIQFGERFSVLSSDPTPQGLRRRVRSMGLGDRFVSERVVGASVSDLRRSPGNAFDRMIQSAKLCVEDGADVIVLGCLAMCFVDGLVERLQQVLGIPVINPVIAGVKSAEASLNYGISTRTRPARTKI
ncbi:aspartate/glutamate racemase family protein [Rhizobium puerariae]|uniref:Aspartate/glutamate racemase family protein n=1 Tax=Rhizobium puerariae TaxID=1585791 RepID=A0ABV6AFZ4_9HYPH